MWYAFSLAFNELRDPPCDVGRVILSWFRLAEKSRVYSDSTISVFVAGGV